MNTAMKSMQISEGPKNALGLMNVTEVTFINPSALFGPSKICIKLISGKYETATKRRTTSKVGYL
jgi:hypothetical protein